jgi:hypothetical protein
MIDTETGLEGYATTFIRPRSMHPIFSCKSPSDFRSTVESQVCVSKFHIDHTYTEKCLKLLRRRLGAAVLATNANDDFNGSGPKKGVMRTVRVDSDNVINLILRI